jgi:hypothetical protein
MGWQCWFQAAQKRLIAAVRSVTHLGVLVGGVVVADHVQLPARVGAGDLLEEGEELLVAVAGGAPVDDVPGRDLQRGEQGRGAVPDVVVGALLGAPGWAGAG